MKLGPEAAARISQQLGQADLGDPRRSKRLARVALKLAEAPSASIPLALGTDAEVQGAYRLMNNRRVTFEAVLAPHIDAAVENARFRVWIPKRSVTCRLGRQASGCISRWQSMVIRGDDRWAWCTRRPSSESSAAAENEGPRARTRPGWQIVSSGAGAVASRPVQNALQAVGLFT